MNTSLAIVILAAGASTRLGRPKQNVVLANGYTLLQQSIRSAHATGNEIYVILGAHRDIIIPNILFEDAHIIFNEKWAEGMASSLRLAIETCGTHAAILFMVCDQPYLTTDLLKQLIEKYQQQKGIVACQYTLGQGVPMVVDSKYFTYLKGIEGDKGAKVLLQQYPNDISFIPFEKGNIDIDTQDDLQQLGLA